MTYKNKTYHLADNLDPNIFTTDVWTIPLYDGTTLDIPSGENDRWKLTSLIFKFCDQTKDVIDAHFLFGCQGLTQLDLTGLSYIRVLGTDSFVQCHALTYADFSSWTNIEAIGTHFLFSCNSLVEVNMGKIPARFLEAEANNVSFTCGTITCIPYVDGLKIYGDDKESYPTRFPKLEGTVWNMWRNLVVG